MSELANELRKFADGIERGSIAPGAQMCAIVTHDGKGLVTTTYIGREVPAQLAGMNLLSLGIQHGVQTLARQSATHGSTH